MTVVCPACGFENSEQARFCGGCAAPLDVVAPTRETRKTVTIVFCDVTGSTSLGERLDPESLRRVLARYFEAMRLVIEQHGGTVEKFIGDAVMAVFGLPHAHGNDAERALAAALTLRDIDDISCHQEVAAGRVVSGYGFACIEPDAQAQVLN